MPHTRRFRRKHLRSLDASSPRSFTCPLLHGLTLETALTRSLPNLRRLLRRLSIRPVAQTDGSFGQTSLQGPETSGNVLNRSLRCFLPCAAIDPKAGAHRLVNSPDMNTCLCCPPCAYVCEFSISWCTRCRAGSRFFEHGLIGGNKKNCHIPPTHFFCVGGFSHFKQFLPSHPRFFRRRVS